jgi:uncharacterized lipoprotein YehR (DUF1307 family)
MRAQLSRFHSASHVSTVLAILAALMLAGCGKEPTAEGDSSRSGTQKDSSQAVVNSDSSRSTQKDGLAYFADDVLSAWEQAGAKPLWIVHNDDGQITHRSDPPSSVFANLKASGSVLRYMPGFEISNWQDGMTADLPVPKVGFGLDLSPSGVRDTGLQELARFDTLQSLSFYQGRITDDGVKELTALKDLRALSLYNTNLTDVAIKELAKIKTLEYLDLGGRNVRASGAAIFELQKALPNCTIFRRR